MRAFSNCNPIMLTVFFAAVSVITMFCMNPVILALSLCGALLLWFVRKGRTGVKSHLFALIIFVTISLANPLFSHFGSTVLFVMNNNPITLEAFYYGLVMSVAVVAVIYWLRSFSDIMTSDKLIYVFGTVSPKISFMISMILRFVPLFKGYAVQTAHAQKAMGMYGEDNLFARMKGAVRVFSIVVTRALENGIITSDSMEARGYGSKRRTAYKLFRFTASDATLLAVTAALFLISVYAVAVGATQTTFYPTIQMINQYGVTAAAYAAFGILSAMPSVIETGEKIRWKYLQSRI